MIKAYVWVKPNFGRSSTACSQVYVYENKYGFLLRSIFTHLFLNFNLLKYVSECVDIHYWSGKSQNSEKPYIFALFFPEFRFVCVKFRQLNIIYLFYVP